MPRRSQDDTLLPVGPAQRMVYLEHVKQPASTAYNIPVTVDLPFPVAAAELRAALARLLEKYELLRASFVLADDEIRQIVHPPEPALLEIYDDPAAAQARFVRPFDLDRAPLLRAAMVPFDGRTTRLLLDVHHIVADGVALGPLIADLRAAMAGEPLAPEPHPFREYLQWRDSPESRAQDHLGAAFWKECLTPLPPPARWPADRPAAAAGGASYDLVRLRIVGEDAARVQARARAAQATPFTVVLLAFALTQAGLTGNWDGVVATVAAGRVHHRFLKTFGMFANTICLPLRLIPALSVAQALDHVVDATTAALRHQAFPAVELLRVLGLSAPAGRHPLFESLFVYQNVTYQKQDFFGRHFRPFFEGKRDAQFDMVIHVFEAGAGLDVFWEFTPRVYDRRTVETFADYFRVALRTLTTAADHDGLGLGLQRQGREDPPVADFDF